MAYFFGDNDLPPDASANGHDVTRLQSVGRIGPNFLAEIESHELTFQGVVSRVR